MSGSQSRQPGRMHGLILFSFVFALLTCGSADAETLHVDASVIASGNGSSWQEATKSITEAMDLATSGSQVWVATGVYPEVVQLKSGVVLLGGFSGSETNENERDPNANPTALQVFASVEQTRL